MSFKVSIIKKAVKWTPKKMVIWVGNIVLKGIAELTDFQVDLDVRTAYVQLQLAGESESIEVQLNGFAIFKEDEAYKFVLQQAESNKLWLNAIFAKITGKAWKIPAIPQLAPHMALVAELLHADSPEPEVELEIAPDLMPEEEQVEERIA